jgi:succinate dehydrogenase/fumarate reductase cytochrome b subunit
MERWERFAPLTGVAAIVLFIVGVIVEESSASRPDDDTPAAVLEWFQDKADTLIVGSVIFAVAAVLLIWFFGSLRAALVEAEGGTGRLSAIAFGSGLLAAVGILMSLAPTAQGAFSKDDLSPETAQSLVLLGDSAFGVTEFSLVPMFVAVGLLTLRTRVLPVWLGWVSFAIALLLLIIPIGWAGVVWAFPLWTIIVSIILFRRGSAPAAATAPPAP